MIAGPRHLSPPLGERCQVLDEEDGQRIAGAETRGLPAKLLAARCAPRAIGWIAHVDTAPSHRGHVGRQVVALQRDVAEPAAAGQELREPRVGASRSDRDAAVAKAQELEIVVLLEGDRVVGRAPRMGAPRIDVEPDARVGVDTALEVRNADHDVVDAGQHVGLLRAEYATPPRRPPGSDRRTPGSSMFFGAVIAASPDGFARTARRTVV